MEIAALPWVRVRLIFDSYMKRKVREREFSLQLAQLGAMGGMGAMLGETAPPPEEGVDNLKVREMASQGFPVTVRRVG